MSKIFDPKITPGKWHTVDLNTHDQYDYFLLCDGKPLVEISHSDPEYEPQVIFHNHDDIYAMVAIPELLEVLREANKIRAFHDRFFGYQKEYSPEALDEVLNLINGMVEKMDQLNHKHGIDVRDFLRDLKNKQKKRGVEGN